MMSAEILLQHLQTCGVVVALGDDARSLVVDAPAGVLTLELTELMREHKSELVELVYVCEESDAIAWDGCRDSKGRLVTRNDGKLPRVLVRDDDRDAYGREVLGNIPQCTTPLGGNF
jgi:hypothetical protein